MQQIYTCAPPFFSKFNVRYFYMELPSFSMVLELLKLDFRARAFWSPTHFVFFSAECIHIDEECEKLQQWWKKSRKEKALWKERALISACLRLSVLKQTVLLLHVVRDFSLRAQKLSLTHVSRLAKKKRTKKWPFWLIGATVNHFPLSFSFSYFFLYYPTESKAKSVLWEIKGKIVSAFVICNIHCRRSIILIHRAVLMYRSWCLYTDLQCCD